MLLLYIIFSFHWHWSPISQENVLKWFCISPMASDVHTQGTAVAGTPLPIIGGQCSIFFTLFVNFKRNKVMRYPLMFCFYLFVYFKSENMSQCEYG